MHILMINSRSKSSWALNSVSFENGLMDNKIEFDVIENEGHLEVGYCNKTVNLCKYILTCDTVMLIVCNVVQEGPEFAIHLNDCK